MVPTSVNLLFKVQKYGMKLTTEVSTDEFF